MSEQEKAEAYFRELVRVGEEEQELAAVVVDDFTWHELLHGTSIAESTLENVMGRLGARALLRQEPELADAAEKAGQAMFDLYQTVGRLAPHMK